MWKCGLGSFLSTHNMSLYKHRDIQRHCYSPLFRLREIKKHNYYHIQNVYDQFPHPYSPYIFENVTTHLTHCRFTKNEYYVLPVKRIPFTIK